MDIISDGLPPDHVDQRRLTDVVEPRMSDDVDMRTVSTQIQRYSWITSAWAIHELYQQ